MPSQSFTDVMVWKKAHQLVLGIYRLTHELPQHEFFALGDQMRRAVVSVPANFAEGFKKRGRADKVRYYNISQGSLEECRYYLILANDLKYADTSELLRSLEEVSRLLDAYCEATLANAPRTC